MFNRIVGAVGFALFTAVGCFAFYDFFHNDAGFAALAAGILMTIFAALSVYVFVSKD